MPLSPRIQRKMKQIEFRNQEDVRVNQALTCYYKRLRLKEEPQGEIRHGYWFPLVEEHRFCCNVVMKRGLVDSKELQRHCRSYSHVAAMFEVSAARLLHEVRQRTEQEQIDEYLRLAEEGTKELEGEDSPK